VVSLAFAPDGRALYALDTRGEIAAWDCASRAPRVLHRITEAHEVRLPDAQLDSACGGRFLVVRLRSAVHVWDVEAGRKYARLPHEPTGYIPALDPAGRLLALDSEFRTITTWDIAGREPGPPFLRLGAGTSEPFIAFAVSPDGNTVASTLRSDGRHQVALYDRATGCPLARADTFPKVGPVLKLAFSSNGRTLALFGLDRVTLCDVPSLAMRDARIWCTMPSYLFAVHPTRPVLAAVGSNLFFTLFSLDTGEPLRTLDFTVGTSTLKCATFSPDGLTCAVGGSNKQFAVFDVDV
jgi:WD40 repeat protein